MPKRVPQIDAHLEWIGFVRPTGLVVSAPALMRAGAVLPRDPEGQRRLLACVVERRFRPTASPSRGCPTSWRSPRRCSTGACRRRATRGLKHLLPDEAGLAIAERMCNCKGREAVEEQMARLKREEHRRTYYRRRNARMTRDYPGDGLPVESEDEET